jgi:hypothetical protein
VKIFLQPRETLVVLLSGSAMTTRRFATCHTNELATLDWRNFYLRRRTVRDASQDTYDRTQRAENASDHVLKASGNAGGKPFQNVEVMRLIGFPRGKVLP